MSPAIAQYGAPPPDLGAIGHGDPPGPPPPPSVRGNEVPPPSDIAGPQQPSPNNATTGTGSIGVTDPSAVGGECAKGFSEETCRRRGQQYNPPR